MKPRFTLRPMALSRAPRGGAEGSLNLSRFAISKRSKRSSPNISAQTFPPLQGEGQRGDGVKRLDVRRTLPPSPS
jgi:hypothetical protein